MMNVQIISSSIREGRQSHKVAQFLHRWFTENTDVECSIIDLKERNFPIFSGRLTFMQEKHQGAETFSQEIEKADAVIMVCPEYNGGYPAALKNVIDLLYDEWQQKPIGLAMVSSGDMAAAQATEQLQFIMYKIGAHVAKMRFHVGNVQTEFNDDGTTTRDEFYQKNAQRMWDNLQLFIK